ncbi:MAG: 2'-5' RNA ligase family protein [Gaiellaceae bacterium]
MPWNAPGSTAIVALTPEVEQVTGQWYRTYSKAGAEGMRPHITLLIPFVPASDADVGVENHLRHVFSGFEPFGYSLERVERWPDVLYLAPEPAQPFIDLTQALVAEFPDLRPYDGRHTDVVPHATVAEIDDTATAARITAELEPQLPFRCQLVEAVVVERGSDHRWRERAAFPLGSLE